jgi:VCBS repeat-containing protein
MENSATNYDNLTWFALRNLYNEKFHKDGKNYTHTTVDRETFIQALTKGMSIQELLEIDDNNIGTEFSVKISGSGTKDELVRDLEKLLSCLKHEKESDLSGYEIEYPALIMEVNEIEK